MSSERVILLQHKQKKKKLLPVSVPLPSLSSWLISFEPAGPAGRGIWQRSSDNPEESWHRERQSLHRLRPDWKMLSTQRADETNQRSQEGCSCRAGWAWNAWEGHCEHTLPHRGCNSYLSHRLQLNQSVVFTGPHDLHHRTTWFTPLSHFKKTDSSVLSIWMDHMKAGTSHIGDKATFFLQTVY